ncbi:MAG: hypothetical protein DMD83_19875 [Candidatus Rokuibacteriota bacterium]|nr:MAG: hypothetical protein DMD83_19875 [Candidatus Rokubacteria bacterium]
MPSAPCPSASSNAAMVFSGASAEAPRWAITRGRSLRSSVVAVMISVALSGRGHAPPGCRPALWLGARTYFRMRFEGVPHIPPSGPLIIVPNHVTYADPVLVSIPVRRPVYYMAWNVLFGVPGLAWLIRRLRAFPVEIESADPKAAREAVRLLQAGAAVMIFPEGGRSPDGRLQRFKPGAPGDDRWRT